MLLSGLDKKSFGSRDEQEVAGYADVMNIVFASYKNISFTDSQAVQRKRTPPPVNHICLCRSFFGNTPVSGWKRPTVKDTDNPSAAERRIPICSLQFSGEYVAAGADVITTNSYVLHRDRLALFGVEDQFETLHRVACRLAMEARDVHGAGLIAGSLGPNAGSYRPNLSLPEARAAEVFAEMAGLQAPYVDLLLLETMSSIEQARGAVMGAQTAGLPVWLAVTVDDNDGTRLRSGEEISMLPGLCKAMTLDTVLVNCSVPEAVTQAVVELTGCGLRVGAYANGFTRITDAFLEPGAKPSSIPASQHR